MPGFLFWGEKLLVLGKFPTNRHLLDIVPRSEVTTHSGLHLAILEAKAHPHQHALVNLVMPVPPTGTPKPRKPRPSRARGLRTTTGCLTCRKRRVKCDEERPRCLTCTKSDRECLYPAPAHAAVSPKPSRPEKPSRSMSTSTVTETAKSTGAVSPMGPQTCLPGDVDVQVLITTSPELMFDSPATNVTSLPSPNSAPREWYALLAEDAINNIDKYNLNLDFDGSCLSRTPSPAQDDGSSEPHTEVEPPVTCAQEQWNSLDKIPLSDDQLLLFQHYVAVIAPIMDLFDPTRQFSATVPRLAVRNVGLLKSLLAVAARHHAFHAESQAHQANMFAHTPGSNMSDPSSIISPLIQTATQYYYETLHYLSQNLLYPSYSKSQEIIATALLISTYEMFDAETQHSNGAWERHLRGIFWIQRSQNNNGECRDNLRRAAWWNWLRQDIWVAFREGRRVLTIWRPTRRLMDLSPDELCLRVIYICGRCVDYAANEKKYDIQTRIKQGGKLQQALNDWYHALPSSFQPIYSIPPSEPGQLFAPIWIHPPSYAAAVQTYHFARVIVLINQPSIGGMDDYRVRQRLLDESVGTICGICMTHQGQDLPSAFINVTALYAAGLCVQSAVKQAAILELLEKTLDITKFPPKSLLDDLVNHWRNEL